MKTYLQYMEGFGELFECHTEIDFDSLREVPVLIVGTRVLRVVGVRHEESRVIVEVYDFTNEAQRVEHSTKSI